MALDITILNEFVADLLGTTDFVGGMLLSTLLLLAVTLAISQVTKSEKVLLIVDLSVILVCTGLGWLPVWIPILIVMILAILYGNVMSRIVGA